MIEAILNSVLVLASDFDSYRAHIAAADAALIEGDSRRAKEWLQGAPAEFRGWEWDYLYRRTDQSIKTIEASKVGITKLVMSPDGLTFASTGADSVIRIWSVVDYSLKAELKGHQAAVFGLNYSPNGKQLVSTSRDNSIRLWDLSSGESSVLGEHPVTPYNAALTPDGKRVLSVGWRMHPERKSPVGLIRVWNVETKSMEVDLDYTTHPISSVIFNRDGSKAYIGCWEYQVMEFDMKTFSIGREFVPPASQGYSAVDAMVLSDDEKYLITATKDKAAKVFDLSTGDYVNQMAHSEHVTALGLIGKTLMTSSQDQSLRAFDFESRREIVRLQGHGMPVSSLAVTPDGKKAFSGDRSGQIKVWDMGHVESYQPEVLFGGAWSCKFSPDGKRIAVGTNQKLIEIIDVVSQKVIKRLGPYGSLVVDVAWSPDGARVAGGSNDGSFRVFEVESGREVWKSTGKSQVGSAAWSLDGRFVAAGESGKCFVYDSQNGEVIFDGELGEYTMNSAFSPDSKYAFFASGKRIVQVDIARKLIVKEFEPAQTDVFDLAVSPDGSWLVVGETSGQVQRFDVASGKMVWTQSITASQWGVAISPDGSRVATTGFDFAMRLLDSGTGRELFSIRNLPIEGFDVGFSPDGSTIAYMGGGLVWWVKK